MKKKKKRKRKKSETCSCYELYVKIELQGQQRGVEREMKFSLTPDKFINRKKNS